MEQWKMEIQMKNSGIEWIGDIPDDWNLIKIGSIFQCRNEKVNDTDYPPLSVSKGGVVPQMDSVAKTDANDNRKLVLQNDFVINSRSDRKQSCGYSTLKGSVSLINIVLYTAADKIILPQYTDYLMKNCGFAEEFYRWGHGIVADLWTTRWQEMKSIVLPIPSIDMQQKIADYLDKKCAAVDKLIENQQAQIEKLKEYKQSVITEAVTKGLDPSSPLKDSGMEWIGEIPNKWKMFRIKDLFELRNERNYEDLSKVNLISLYTEHGVMQHSDIEETTGNKAVKAEGYKLVYKGDIVVNIILCWMGAIGKSNYNGVTSPAYDVYKPKQASNSDYYHYLFRTKGFNGECYRYGRGIMMMRWRTYSSEFRAINVPFPPIKEQQQIADYLDKKCAKIDNLISIKQQKIETLIEYKKSLIYEYVTGKKEAR